MGVGDRGIGAGSWLAAAVLACAVVVLASAAVGTVPVRDDNPLDRFLFDTPFVVPEQEAPAEEVGAPQPTEPARQREPWLPVPLDVVLAVLAVSTALALLVRSLLRAQHDEPVEPLEEDAQEHAVDLVAVTEAARRGLHDLRSAGEGEARDAVVGCWVLLEQAAEPVSGGRLPPDAPTDVADRLLAAAPAVDAAALRRLREVYSAARFGTRPTGGAELQQAVTSLRTVLAGLEEEP